MGRLLCCATPFAYGARGLRGKALAALLALAPAAGLAETVIAALGDSLTQGYGLRVEDGLVPQLQRWLVAQGLEVRLINAGVSGDTTAGGLSRVGWTLTEGPDGLIVALGGNDLLRGLAPDQSRANLTAIVEAAQAEGVPVLLIGISAPGNYGPAYKAEFDSIFPDLAQRAGVTLAPSIFAVFDDMEIEDRRGLMQADGIHPSPQGVAVIVEALGPAVAEFARGIAGDATAD